LDRHAHPGRALVDGAQALSKAAAELNCKCRNCFAHMGRLPNGTKKNGKRGSKGSFCAYLSGAHFTKGRGLNLKEAVKVSFEVKHVKNATGSQHNTHLKILGLGCSRHIEG